MYRSESWQSWPRSASQDNIAEYVNDTENYETIDGDKELFVPMQHSSPRAPSEYADKRYFKADVDSQMSSEAQMIAATSHVHSNRRTKINSPRLKDSQSVKDQKHCSMDQRPPPRFHSQINTRNQCSRNNYEPESKTRDSLSEQHQGPPVDRNLKPEKLRQGRASSSITTNSSIGRSVAECSNTNERIGHVQLNMVLANQLEEEDADTTSASMDEHNLKDFIQQQPGQYNPTQMPCTDNFRKEQTGEDMTSQNTPEWKNFSEENRKTHITDLKMKWEPVREDSESQLKLQKTEKKTEMKISARYLSVINRSISDSDFDGTKGIEEEIVLNENPESGSVHHVKMTIPPKISENVSKKTKVHKENNGRSRRQHFISTTGQKVPECMPKKPREQWENRDNAGAPARQDVKDNSTQKLSEYIKIQTGEKVEQKEDAMVSTKHATPIISQKIHKKCEDQVEQKKDFPAPIMQHGTTTATFKVSKYLPKKKEGQEELKESAGICAQEASSTTSTQLISEPMLYKQEEEQGYETIITLLQDLLSKQESIHPQDEHITFLMSLAPYIKHVPESQQLLMRISVMNTIISFIPSLSDPHTTSISPFIDVTEQKVTATNPSNTL